MKFALFLLNIARNWKTTWAGISAICAGVALLSGDIQVVFTAFSQGHWPDWAATTTTAIIAWGTLSNGIGHIFAKDAAVSGTAATVIPTVVPPVKP